jgi:hypothetical protein
MCHDKIGLFDQNINFITIMNFYREVRSDCPWSNPLRKLGILYKRRGIFYYTSLTLAFQI